MPKYKLLTYLFAHLTLSLLIIIIIDQVMYFTIGNNQSHFIYSLNHPVFKDHPRLRFLLREDAHTTLWKFGIKNNIPPHTNYILNLNGFRVSKNTSNLDHSKNINILGDSFVFGLFLKEGETISDHLNSWSNKCSFRNYGVPGFSFHQMLELSMDRDLIAESDFNIFLFISSDLRRVFQFKGVHPQKAAINLEKLKQDYFPDLNLPKISIPRFFVNNSFIGSTIDDIQHRKMNKPTEEQVYLAMSKKHKAHKGNFNDRFFHIPSLNDYQDDPLLDQSILNLTPEIFKITLISANKDRIRSNVEKYFFKGDGHPNEKGALWIAANLKNQLSDICF